MRTFFQPAVRTPGNTERRSPCRALIRDLPVHFPSIPTCGISRIRPRICSEQARRRRLANAQFQVARQYGFASWPKLKAHVESLQTVGQLKQAIDANDLERVKRLMTRDPELH